MASGRQGLHHLRVEAVLELQRGAFLAPGFAQQPARRAHRLLQSLAVKRVAAEHRRLALRLAVATHIAVNHVAAIVEARMCRVQGVEGLFVRSQNQVRGRVQRKTRTPVLPGNAGVCQHHARAKLPVHALDIADHAPLRIGRAHPDGVTGNTALRPGQGPGHVHGFDAAVDKAVA